MLLGFTRSLSCIVNASNHTKCASLNNQQCRIPNKIEDLNLNVFNMIVRINESKTLTKHSSCEYKYKFDVEKCNLNQKWNKDKCLHERKNLTEHNACEKDYIWNPAACSCQNGEYVVSIIDHSVITCDEIIEATKSTLTNLSILLTFSLITIA